MPKIVDHDRYRKELLHGCLDLFAERGYGSITMRQIAKGLGVSTGTLYHYFPSKESIFMQLVQELCEQDISSFFAQAPEGLTLEGRLRAIMAFVLQNAQFYYQQLVLWVDFFQQTPPLATMVKSIFCVRFGNARGAHWQTICNFPIPLWWISS